MCNEANLEAEQQVFAKREGSRPVAEQVISGDDAAAAVDSDNRDVSKPQ